MDKKVAEMVDALKEIGAIKQGSFRLKSGELSSIYIDLRELISFPELLEKMSLLLWEKAQGLKMDLLAGVPYSALPLATAISLREKIPMCLCRKEPKEYGTGKLIEGRFQAGMRVLILEDVVTSGGSIEKLATDLRAAGLEVNDAVAFLDRQAGGKEKLHHIGIDLHTVLTLQELLGALER